MAEATTEAKLIQDYEAIRQRQHDLITGMLTVLPKIEKLGDERIAQVRDALFHADHPFLMVFVGPFSSGKSSILNALLGKTDLLPIGPTPTTDRINILRYGDEAQRMNSAGEADTVFYPSPMLRRVSFVDTPGLESILKVHEDTTRKFLHRCDVVMLVMLATRAMTQSNLEYLQIFKEYGKKIIIVINQVDLLSDEEKSTVRDYVLEQSRDKLGFVTDIWMVSARQAIAAYQPDGSRDEAAWQASGLNQIEAYIEKSLGDADRLRQKLQTPLQIVQNVHKNALEAVRANQSTFDSYRSITDNVERQLDYQKREQTKAVADTIKEIEYRFGAVIDRSNAALKEIFLFNKALRSLVSGVGELTGLARLFRRANTPSVVGMTFKNHKVFDPLDELSVIADKLPPRLEGQDMQDIDDLVKYGQKEVNNLPLMLREKLIGTIQAPLKYDREPFTGVRIDLDKIEDDARILETEKLESVRRNTLLYLAVWELIVIILVFALFQLWGPVNAGNDAPVGLLGLILLLCAALLGFAWLPLRGRMIAVQHANRLSQLQKNYIETMTKAADKQIEYGVKLRRDAIAPLTRLVDAQSSIQDEQLNSLQSSAQMIAKLEADLNAFGKRKFMGMTM